jgi:hypothetical protein
MNENKIKEHMMTKDTAESIIPSMRAQIAAVDENTIMAVVGVAQALDELRKALGEVDACLDSRDLEKASALGYGSVSSGFIFLQRTLGELNRLCSDKSAIVGEVAVKLGCAYEEALPHVDAVMESSRPRRKAAGNL